MTINNTVLKVILLICFGSMVIHCGLDKHFPRSKNQTYTSARLCITPALLALFALLVIEVRLCHHQGPFFLLCQLKPRFYLQRGILLETWLVI